jgi:uncharacterized membrane protein (DUF2068 family)
MKRPTGVTIIAILAIIGGILGVLGGLAGLAGGALLAGGAAGTTAAAASGTVAIFSAILLIFGVLDIVLGIGLLRLRPWAWTLGVALQVASIVLAVIEIATGNASIGNQALGLAINVIILVYLFRGNVRQAFARA